MINALNVVAWRVKLSSNLVFTTLLSQ